MASMQRIHGALRDRMLAPIDAKGYTKTPTENLVEGVSMELFEDDLRRGSGDELRMKFRAAHSSAALAVNSFAWFKPLQRRCDLTLLDEMGADDLKLECQFPIFARGTPPNLDVWIERDQANVAIESKLLEYFSKKKPKFSQKYEQLAPPGLAEPCWWEVYQQAKSAGPQHLDVAQLVKHYFGLWKFQQGGSSSKPLRFLYLFWEPSNWEVYPACQEHREQLKTLTQQVDGSIIRFSWMTYSDLWQKWSENQATAQHARNLKDRYEFSA